MQPTSLLHSLPIAEVPEEIGWWIFFYVGLVFATIFALFAIGRRGITSRVFVGLPAKAVEHAILVIDNVSVGVIGERGRRYAPFLFALWSFILVGNIFGLIFNFTPTAEWSMNLSLAVITMVYVQYEGIRANGPLGHALHFSGPRMGGALIMISVLLFFIEATSEVMKLMSLSLRLYGNIHGGHEVVTGLNGMVAIPLGGHVFHLPLGGILLPLKLMTAILQAYIFVVLTATYLSLVTHDDHDEEHRSEPQPVAA